MRADIMTWVSRAVAAVFLVGVLALIGLMVTLIRSAEGVPPLPVFLGILGLVGLILLAGACLALISIALSAKRGVEALGRLSGQSVAGSIAPQPVAVKTSKPFEGPSLRQVMREPVAEPEPAVTAPSRPSRPATGRTLVAER
ncbi:hypothetical protein H4P12_07575 [Paracoccus sp. 11-3]|uniref:Uncharacterized protein n=1 Tax=Paracoccus amoyensis TaxID=2760093 RepID=A0A926G8S0_9RHOB|nr:hypothetical protein [Paracoccus amoyensis]MBC9246573.1 hypothetical protein [Paracoccus amoyensis]